jgi:membrane protease YdiL (CAAX protease family)
MNDDPESTSVPLTPAERAAEAAPQVAAAPENQAEPLTSTAQILAWPAPREPLTQMETTQPLFVSAPPPAPRAPRLIPNIGHFFVFLGLLIPALIGGYILTLLVMFAANPRGGFMAVLGRVTTLARNKDLLFALTMQAAIYCVLLALTGLVFSLWWHGFRKGIQWNGSVALRRFFWLAGAGLATGLLITVAGNFVPMPKAPPILDDLTKSRLGAWVLMAFGVTLAPLTEELAFRGFLLPGLINIFVWLGRKGTISEVAVSNVGVPLSIVLTSIPFAYMHSAQVGNSWGPVLLIGVVSVILCVVRLSTRSLACSIIVHSFYNLTLFTGLLIQTDGFRHLEKLKG